MLNNNNNQDHIFDFLSQPEIDEDAIRAKVMHPRAKDNILELAIKALYLCYRDMGLSIASAKRATLQDVVDHTGDR